MTSNLERRTKPGKRSDYDLAIAFERNKESTNANECAANATTMSKKREAIGTAMDFIVTMIADEINVTSIANLSRQIR